MYYCKKVNIDKKALEAGIKRSGLTKSEFSRSLGRSPSFIQKYVGNAKSTYDSMLLTDYKLIVATYGFEFESKEPEKPVTEEKSSELTVADLTPTELSKLIYKSVFAAVKHAWENDEGEE